MYEGLARALGICWLAALAICQACASADHVRLQPEQDTTLHVGQTAAVYFASNARHSIGSGGRSLVLTRPFTDKDGSTVYIYRASRVGRDTLVATPESLPAAHCISCVTTHYFINVVP
jgi:hypothetical protein